MNNDSNITITSPDKAPGAVGTALTGSAAPGSFSVPVAQWLAGQAAEAYKAATCTDKATWASANVVFDSGHNAVVVAFKGSSEAQDFFQDAKFEMVPLVYQGTSFEATAHRGFVEDIQAITIAVVSQVRGYLHNNPTAKVFITGHSLGGALAILCAFEFSKQSLPVTAVYTFGQPRVGNHFFCFIYDQCPCGSHLLKEVTFRLVNGNDIVPRLPGKEIGYDDCGHEMFLPTTSNSIQVDPDLFEKALSDGSGLFQAIAAGRDVLINDHFIAAYQKRIALIP